MRGLTSFIIKHHFFILFLLLQLASLALLFRNNQFHRSSFINSSNNVVGQLYAKKADFGDYLDLQEQNTQLATENAELRTRYIASRKSQLGREEQIKDSLYMQQYTYNVCKVINSSVTRRNNYITINKGSIAGIEEEMGVISASGIVGYVANVSENFATIIPLLNNQLNVTARMKNSDYFGQLNWGGINPKMADLNDVPTHAYIQIGDSVVTRGSSTIFPAGVLIGTVHELNEDGSGNFHNIEVKLSTDFYNLNYVYVVTNLLRKEQVLLEQTTAAEDAE